MRLRAVERLKSCETREHAREAITRFATEYGPKYPKAVTTLEKDADTLLTFFDFPGEHWKRLRTSNVIESPFATVRLRQRVTKGAGSRTKGLLMAYQAPRHGADPVAPARRRASAAARPGWDHVRGRRAVNNPPAKPGELNSVSRSKRQNWGRSRAAL